jgi:hypothetical protein
MAYEQQRSICVVCVHLLPESASKFFLACCAAKLRNSVHGHAREAGVAALFAGVRAGPHAAMEAALGNTDMAPTDHVDYAERMLPSLRSTALRFANGSR